MINTRINNWKKDIMPSHIPRNAKLFLTGMVLSGFGDGIIMTVAQLYFISLGLQSSDFGSIFMLKALGTALVTIPAGYMADKFGKRKILIAGFGIFSVGLITLLVTKNLALLRAAMLLIGLSDATYVVLGPMYSSFFSNQDMDKAFGFRGFLNILSISIGSLLGFIPPMLVNRFEYTYSNAYWTLFAFAAVFFIARLPFFLMASREINGRQLSSSFVLSKESRQVLIKFIIIAVLGTVGYEVFFSFFPLFLKTKFNAESDALGLLFSLSWAASALANIVSPKISSKIGTVTTITLAYALCAPLYLGMRWAPSLVILGVLYLTRRGIANLAAPLTSSLMMKILKEEEKATASGFTMTAQRLGSAFSTWLGGWLITTQSINAPIYVGAVLYIVYAVAMYSMFSGVETTTLDAVQPIMEIKNND